jgi:hypothetical protein
MNKFFIRALLRGLIAATATGSLAACTVHTTTQTATSPPPPPPPPPPPASTPEPPPPPPQRAQAHPAYLHALSDLRNARANLERRGGDVQTKWDERGSVEAIDRAIREINQAAIDDGKSLQEHPPIDAHEPRAGRLHKAVAALRSAREDVGKEEDNAFASGLRARGLRDIDEAIGFAEQGVVEAERTAGPVGTPPAATARPAAQTHPAYLHALADLRNARANLERTGGDPKMKWDERGAILAIDRAMGAVRQAAIDDGKNPQDHPPIDAHEPRVGRLHKALSALRAARDDIGKEEDNTFANGLRARALNDVDEAIRFAEQGIAEADHSS